jgi:uncharacterized protein YbjT (DUF2867 family)
MNHESDDTPKILVTGATGRVGSSVLNHLLESGKKVRIFVRDPTKVSGFGANVEVRMGDLSKADTISEALMGIERVFLVTGATEQDSDVIVEAKKQGVRQVVKLSTQEAGMPDVKGHSHWHREREKLIESSGLAWTFLRPTMFMDTALQWAGSIKAEGIVRFPAGDGRVAPIDPDDVGAVGATALMSDAHFYKAYELTGSELLSIREMVETLSHVIGRQIRYVDIPESVVKEQFLKMNLPEYVADGLVETFQNVRAGRFAYRTQVVESLLGRPALTFENWCRKNHSGFQ